jgi:hypothetical protein
MAATLTGYGFVVLSAPLLALLFPAPQVVPLTLALGWVLISAVLVRPAAYRAIDLAEAGPFAVAGLVGIPLGAALLDVVSQHTLRVLLGGIVVISAVAPLLSRRLTGRQPLAASRCGRPPGGAIVLRSGWVASQEAQRRRPAQLARYAAGLASGVLSGCVGLNGPPVALYLALRGTSKEQARATSAAVVWLLSTATLVYYAATAHLPAGVTPWALVLMPALALGWAAGSRLFRAISTQRFTQVSLTCAALAGVAAVLTALRA